MLAYRRAGVLLVFAILAFSSVHVRAQFDDPIPLPGEAHIDHVGVDFLLSQSALRSGDSAWLAVRFQIEEGHHLYSPEEVNLLAAAVRFDPAPGLVFGPVYRPPGRRVVSSGNVSWEYEGEVYFLCRATALPDAEPGKRKFTARIDAQVCTRENCYLPTPPGGEPFSFEIDVAAAGAEVPQQHVDVFEKWIPIAENALSEGAKIDVLGGQDAVRPGDRLWVAVRVTPPAESYLSGPTGPGVGLSIEPVLPEGWKNGLVSYPAPESITVELGNGVAVEAKGYRAPVVAGVAMDVPASAGEGKVALSFRVRYQANRGGEALRREEEGTIAALEVAVTGPGSPVQAAHAGVVGPLARALGVEFPVHEEPVPPGGKTWVAIRLTPPTGAFLFGASRPKGRELSVEVLDVPGLKIGPVYRALGEEPIEYRTPNGLPVSSKGYRERAEFGFRVEPSKDASGLYHVPVLVRYAVASETAELERSREGGDLYLVPVDVGGGTPRETEDAIFERLDEEEKKAGKAPDDLLGKGLLVLLLVAFAAGVAADFSPCVLPMIPITVGFFGGQAAGGARKSIGKALGLAVSYVLGLCVTYTILGMVAALAGKSLAGWAENPYVIWPLAGVLGALSLSFFGAYEIKLPDALLSKFGAGQARSGLAGAFAMGALLGFVAAPCVGPFIATLIIAVALSGKILWGAATFFVFGLGMGMLFLVLAVSSDFISNVPVQWMTRIKHLFGFLLLAAIVWFVKPLLVHADKAWVAPVLWGAIGLVGGIVLGAFDQLATADGWGARIFKSIGVVGCLLGLLYFLSGMQALGVGPQAVASGTQGTGSSPALASEWLHDHDEALAKGKAEGKPVFLDFYTESCIPCKIYSEQVFPEPQVASELDRFVKAKLDATRPENERLQTQTYAAPSLPLIVLYDSKGKEVRRITSGGLSVAELAAILREVR
ncbi:MAG: sulfite exporter TauE/SafE family protein [Planctomycetes bacterium]|nr:sulfite exporter TauE/SafE family protein [Planctomycetota bacterium]